MLSAPRSTRTAALVLALLAGCRDRSAPPSLPDSALAQDLAMAQRPGDLPSVFNDAPIGGAAPASRAKAAPSARPEPPRAAAPTPRPSPRRQAPPAPVQRTPRAALPQPVATAPAPVPAPVPSPAPSPAPSGGTIGAGSRVGMVTNGRVCTGNALPGDKFTATTSAATMGSNGAMIPAGATVVLEVAAIDRADPVESSRIEFRVRQIDINGEPYPAAGDVATLSPLETVRASSGNDRTKVIGGAVAGAVLGRILGRSTKATVIGAAAGAAAGTAAAKSSESSNACLPAGSALRLTLARDIAVRRDSPI